MAIRSLARPEILAMKAYSSARTEAPAQGVLLNANEMPIALSNNGEQGSATGINRYPQPQPADIVNTLAALYDVAPERLLVTRGSDEGIDLLVRVFCRAGADSILECPPDFGMYRIAAQTQGASVIRAPRKPEHDFRLDVDAVLECLSSDSSVKLVFLTSPNNPTGDLVSRPELIRVLEETAGRALVVLDEAYIEFCQSPSAVDLLERYEHLVILRTLSKAWAAAGLRCGATIADPRIIELLRRIMAPYPLAVPVINAVRHLLDPANAARQQAMIGQVMENKIRLIGLLDSLPYISNLWAGVANFVLIRLDHADDLLAYCAGKGVLLRGFASEPLLKDCIRITVGTNDEIDALSVAMISWSGR